MKKILLLVVLCVMFSFKGMAEVICEGTPMTGRNGHVYCVSTQEMHWYAALAWCSAQNRHLASLSEACDYNGLSYGTNAEACPNLTNMDSSSNVRMNVWLANPCIGPHGLSSYVAYASGSGTAAVQCTFNGNRFALAAFHPHAICY